MKNLPIKCFKYNHSLEETVQKFPFYESTLALSEDSKEIIIMNKKFNSTKEHRKAQSSY